MNNPKRIVISGGAFSPPGLNHIVIEIVLIQHFDLVIVVPCGQRPDKQSVNFIAPIHREKMVELAFADIPNLQIDNFDLKGDTYTPTCQLQEKYAAQFPDAEIWHVVGSDLIAGGRNQDSQIHRIWINGPKVWKTLNFAIIIRPGYELVPEDLPPSHMIIKTGKINGSSTEIRNNIAARIPTGHLTTPQVYAYIKKHRLYTTER